MNGTLDHSWQWETFDAKGGDGHISWLSHANQQGNLIILPYIVVSLDERHIDVRRMGAARALSRGFRTDEAAQEYAQGLNQLWLFSSPEAARLRDNLIQTGVIPSGAVDLPALPAPAPWTRCMIAFELPAEPGLADTVRLALQPGSPPPELPDGWALDRTREREGVLEVRFQPEIGTVYGIPFGLLPCKARNSATVNLWPGPPCSPSIAQVMT